MSKKKYPGKRSTKRVVDMSPEEYRLHRINCNATAVKYVKRSAEYTKRHDKNQRDRLTDNYIKHRLRKMFGYMGVQVDITPEMVVLKRQQLKLWRMAHD